MTKSIFSRVLLTLGLLLFVKTLSAQLLSLSVNNGGNFCLGEVTELTINGGTSPYIIDFGDSSPFIQTAFTPLPYTY